MGVHQPLGHTEPLPAFVAAKAGRTLVCMLEIGASRQSGSGLRDSPACYPVLGGWNSEAEVTNYLRRQGRPACDAGIVVRHGIERGIPSLLGATRPSSPSALSLGAPANAPATPYRLAGFSPATNPSRRSCQCLPRAAPSTPSLGTCTPWEQWEPSRERIRRSAGLDSGRKSGMCHHVTRLRGSVDGSYLRPLS